MIIGSDRDKLEDIIRDMKKHTSSEPKTAIKNHTKESRREWILWMMELAGKKNSNSKDWQFWQQHNNTVNELKPLIQFF
jgi:putative transposase